MVEHLLCKQGVVGSSPISSTPKVPLTALPGRRPVSPKRAAHDARKASTTKQAATAKVFQLKVTSRDIKPPIWRRVLVDGSETLDEVHDVIQAAFGW